MRLTEADLDAIAAHGSDVDPRELMSYEEWEALIAAARIGLDQSRTIAELRDELEVEKGVHELRDGAAVELMNRITAHERTIAELREERNRAISGVEQLVRHLIIPKALTEELQAIVDMTRSGESEQ